MKLIKKTIQVMRQVLGSMNKKTMKLPLVMTKQSHSSIIYLVRQPLIEQKEKIVQIGVMNVKLIVRHLVCQRDVEGK